MQKWIDNLIIIGCFSCLAYGVQELLIFKGWYWWVALLVIVWLMVKTISKRIK